MAKINQTVIPAARSLKDYEQLMKLSFEHIILLDVNVSQLPYVRKLAREFEKKIILHADLIQGLRSDEAGAQFLAQVIKPAGLISTHSNVIAVAKKQGLISVHRIFLLDSHSLETSYRIVRNSEPDYVEVLPGVIPKLISEVLSSTQTPVIAGGFISTPEEAEQVLKAGASAVTTSSRAMWRQPMRTAVL